MTDRRDPERKLLRDVARAKAQLRGCNAALKQQSQLLDELRMELIEILLGGRIAVEYFHLFIGVENVVDESGRIDREELELRLASVLARHPGLAAAASADV